MSTNEYFTCIGLMSGTSLDGLDIALCQFSKTNAGQYKILAAKTYVYDNELRTRLEIADEYSGLELAQLHVDLGKLHGEWVKDFLSHHNQNIDFIASHGHTIFHQPQDSLTLQIGSAPHIAAITGIPVVADFRTSDVAHGGQGAPLVPIGDELLFGQYDYCLNLGGIANISFRENGKRVACDIALCNIPLNYYAEKLGLSFDRNGDLARIGNVNVELLELLQGFPFFSLPAPKSLGKEFFIEDYLQALAAFPIDACDILATCVEHTALEIGKYAKDKSKKMLVTGGGALNAYLMERIAYYSEAMVVIPDEETVQFKEALIFAFLGYLRWTNQVNCLASVTGARKDVIGGAIYL
jgi:anhydro-N-acetylmuramic acid kinase